MRSIFYALGVGFLAILAQMVLPEIRTQTLVFPIVLVPLVIIFSALWSPGEWVFLIAVFLGIICDFLSPGIPAASVVSLGLVAALMRTQRHFLWTRRPAYQALLGLAGTFLTLFLDYLFYSWQLGWWRWPADALARMLMASLVAGALAPPFFWTLKTAARRSGVTIGKPTLPAYASR